VSNSTLTKILIVDDHQVVRDGIKSILGQIPRESVFGEAATPAEALTLITAQQWDVAILDISLGGRSDLELLKDLLVIRPSLRVLILTMHSEEQYARRAFKGGAAGYITKDSARSELVSAVMKIMNGGRYVSSAVAETLILDLGRDTDKPLHESLSLREFEVLRLIASGKRVGEIADVLSLSDKTVSTYRSRILEKMRMKTNAELTHYAITNKLFE
jgi:two-component system, NarL family, invasion response regulator UvrY